MVEITENGVESTLLIVKAYKDNKQDFTGLHWSYPDKPNAYFLIGVLEAIKLELLDHIASESQKRTPEPLKKPKKEIRIIKCSCGHFETEYFSMCPKCGKPQE